MDQYKSELMSISYDAVVHSDYPAVIRMAAVKIMAHEYLDVGTFLKELPQSDIEELLDIAARITAGKDTDRDFDSMVLLGCMLSQAEGALIEDVSPQARTSNLLILITFEDLERKGIIEFDRSKATLCNEELEPNIASIK